MKEIYNDTTKKMTKIQNFTLHNYIKIEKLNESVLILNLINVANSFINNLKKDYDILLTAILFTKRGKLVPRLITMEHIFNIAKKTFLIIKRKYSQVQ